jgi:hypothetical protein
MSEKKRGRPRTEIPGGTISAWVPSTTHDRLIQVAKMQQRSISAVVRECLQQVSPPVRSLPKPR